MTIFLGVKDGQIFTRDSKTKQYEYVVIVRQRKNQDGWPGEDPDEWQAKNWCGRLDLARKEAAKNGKYFNQVEIIPVFQKSAAEVKIMKEDLNRQKKAREEALALYEAEQEAARQAAARELEEQVEQEAQEDLQAVTDQEEAEAAARMAAYYEAKKEEQRNRFKGKEEAEQAPEDLLKEAQAASEAGDGAALISAALKFIAQLPPLPKKEEAPEPDILENWQERLGGISTEEGVEAMDSFDSYMKSNRDRILKEIHEEEAPEQPGPLGPVPYSPSLICKACGRLLSGSDSIKRGYGDKCWRRVWKFVSGKQDPTEATLKAGDSVRHGTISDPARAFETRLDIDRRLIASEETCACGKPLADGELWTYDHDGGYMLPGYEKPQWIYTQCPDCGHQTSLRKLRSIDIEDLETEGRREAGLRLAQEEAAKAAKKHETDLRAALVTVETVQARAAEVAARTPAGQPVKFEEFQDIRDRISRENAESHKIFMENIKRICQDPDLDALKRAGEAYRKDHERPVMDPGEG